MVHLAEGRSGGRRAARESAEGGDAYLYDWF
jgi:hypothetical protein